jgi:hypothetical protein
VRFIVGKVARKSLIIYLLLKYLPPLVALDIGVKASISKESVKMIVP